MTPAAASWSITAADAHACMSTTALKYLRLMLAIPSAFEVALLDKLSNGDCRKLKRGEAVDQIEDSSISPPVIKIHRSNGNELFVPKHFVGQSIYHLSPNCRPILSLQELNAVVEPNNKPQDELFIEKGTYRAL